VPQIGLLHDCFRPERLPLEQARRPNGIASASFLARPVFVAAVNIGRISLPFALRLGGVFAACDFDEGCRDIGRFEIA
jgi:hypothetical protein